MSGKKRLKKRGLSPGTYLYIGDRPAVDSRVEHFSYDSQRLERKEYSWKEISKATITPGRYHWLKISGVNCIQMVQKLETEFELHPLMLEDLLNTQQKPKIEVQKNYLFIVVKIFNYRRDSGKLEEQQIGIFLFDDLLISIEEERSSFFKRVVERLENEKSRLRNNGVDYLCYALLDLIVDDYFVQLEEMEAELESIEETIISQHNEEPIHKLNSIKRHLLGLKRGVWPLREVVAFLKNSDFIASMGQSAIFFNDVYDHLVQIIEIVENCRELAVDLINIYLTTVSNRMNLVMKFLTMIATIFIPLTFIAGIYGMNFRFMPELEWRWGYPAVLLVMLISALALIFYFRRRNWF